MKASQIIGWLIWVKARLELIKRDTERRVCTSKLEESSHPLPPNPLQVGVSWNWGVFHPSAKTVPNQRCDWTATARKHLRLLYFTPYFFPAVYSAGRVPRKANPPPNPPLFPAPKLSEPHTAFTSQTYLSVDEEGTIIHKRFESDAANQCGEKKPRKDERGDAVTVMEVMMEMVMRSRAAP